MIDQLKPLLGKLALFSQERLGFKHPPKLFLRNDSQNSQQALGKTAFYNPQEQSVTLFIHGRHPKDILRSFTHELVHHCQNERGDLSPDKMTASGANYAQECPHMRKMEKEAYLKGNMCFRDWEDTIEDKDLILIKLAESKFLKENKTMTTKITKEFLKETIRNILKEEYNAPVASMPDAKSKEDILKSSRSVLDQFGRNSAITPADLTQTMQNVAKLGAEGAELAKEIAAVIMKKVRNADARIAAGDVLKSLDKPELMGTRGTRAFADMARDLGHFEEGVEINPAPSLEEGCGGAHKRSDGKCSKCGKRDCGTMEEAKNTKDCKSCNGTGKKDGKKCDHCNGEGTHPVKEEGLTQKQKDTFDSNNNNRIDSEDLENLRNRQEESKIQTPEQENTLYEQRFAPKNNRLFEKLVKEWAK